MDEISVWMKEKSVTQAVAAEVLQVTRPRVSDVVNHQSKNVTIDALVRGPTGSASCDGQCFSAFIGQSG